MSITSAPAALLKDCCLTFKSGRKLIHALKGVTINFENGNITGILGPDAAGKTTLLRVLAGLLVPDSGHVSVFDNPPAILKKKKPNMIGYMPQRFGLYEDLSVMDNLELYANLSGVDKDRKEEVFQRLLKFTSLSPFTSRLAANLSGGMKQKLGIACVLLGEPRLLLLDEPGVGVDPRSRRELWDMVNELVQEGMTVLWATSYMDEASRCPHLVALEQGNILFSGEPAELASRVNGKVYLIRENIEGAEKRARLNEWSEKAGIIDVRIQGDLIRVEAGGVDEEQGIEAIRQKHGIQTESSLGDYYVSRVGGIDKRPSPFARIKLAGQGRNQNSGIIAQNLTKKFGDFTAVSNISIHVRPGEIIGLLGPNGAGKSTTFRMLCGLLRPTSGSCSVDGVNMLNSGSEARNHLGYMSQKFSLYSDISVWQNIYISGTLYCLPKKRIKDFGTRMGEALGLQDWLKIRTGDLPLGLRQRLSLLCATLHEPPVLFLDEPTSGVDVRTRRDFWKHISALAHAGTAVLVTTHFMEEAEYCDNIALIYRGEMIEYGSPAKLRAGVKNIENPNMEDAFIAAINYYDTTHSQ